MILKLNQHFLTKFNIALLQKQYAFIYKLILEHHMLSETDRTIDELLVLTEPDA